MLTTDRGGVKEISVCERKGMLMRNATSDQSLATSQKELRTRVSTVACPLHKVQTDFGVDY